MQDHLVLGHHGLIRPLQRGHRSLIRLDAHDLLPFRPSITMDLHDGVPLSCDPLFLKGPLTW
ncbi:hypothetical protein SACS_0069 [Parasaccharibacter apium]|uniref:Uncharacterized protein n=1 Tax=Parasaccharibacter apium TaxID=1510841 RepID=A0A7U7G477_9PROT|nr:hypothetical protein SACS_0069 [Parasaccharibacter apium]